MDFYVVFPAKEACVADRLTSQTPDQEVRGSSIARRVVSFHKELYFNLPLFSQVYKWVQPCDGLATRPGGVAVLQGMLHANETGISSGHLAFGSCAPLPSFCTLHIGNVFPSLVINPSINIRHSNSKRRNLFFLGYRDLTVFFVSAKN